MIVAVIPLGLLIHGEPRFVFFPVWLLIAVGAYAVFSAVTKMDRRLQIVLVVIGAIMWVPLFVETAGRADRNAEARGLDFAVLVDASRIIEADAAGSCGVLTTYLPQVTWYSTCWTGLFSPDTPDLGLDRLQGDRDFALLFENGKRQPTGEEEEAYLELGPVETIAAQTEGIGDATIVFINGG